MNKMIKYGYLTATASLLMLACNAGNTKHDQGQHAVLDSSVQEGFVAMLDSNTLKDGREIVAIGVWRVVY
ncbi:hypothetical protein [Sphingobacterium sp. IITKGP-BTPF85]|uniref:hypothetical protein n=1 Tax=Sphingobacterium sp. IITKGP-BTPF85 TaxID=1338009 RepID=UPI000389F46F|nr:hypothetical protein [Sphingobacterium sp. IITKGP-BTPF85]KKX51382.1 hypothetical protein L950_0205705 [Sphingobacterium sp. IITKGP-BTPF85]